MNDRLYMPPILDINPDSLNAPTDPDEYDLWHSSYVASIKDKIDNAKNVGSGWWDVIMGNIPGQYESPVKVFADEAVNQVKQRAETARNIVKHTFNLSSLVIGGLIVFGIYSMVK